MAGLCEGGNEPPGSLKADQVQMVCCELQHLISEHGKVYLNFIITGDESWLHNYDPGSKHASRQGIIQFSMPKEAKVVPLVGK
ncbi:hypothetical protein ANN_12800, partial [Periplaneta americana]